MKSQLRPNMCILMFECAPLPRFYDRHARAYLLGPHPLSGMVLKMDEAFGEQTFRQGKQEAARILYLDQFINFESGPCGS